MKVKFEIVGLYPIYGYPNQHLTFSAHVYVIDPLPLDIRGWLVHYKVDDESKVYVPMGKAYDFDEKKIVNFPIIESDQNEWIHEVKQELIKEAEEEFKAFKFIKHFPKNFVQYQERNLALKMVAASDKKKDSAGKKKAFAKKIKKPNTNQIFVKSRI